MAPMLLFFYFADKQVAFYRGTGPNFRPAPSAAFHTAAGLCLSQWFFLSEKLTDAAVEVRTRLGRAGGASWQESAATITNK